MTTLRVLLVDDHPVFRRGLAIGLADHFDVCGEAASGEEAVLRVLELRPDVVLMDLHMPGMSGIEATRRIADTAPDVGVLVLTMLQDDDSVFAALRAGAHGYLLKESDEADIVRAVEAVHRREAIFGPGVAERVLAYFARAATSRDLQPFPELTDREREVLELVARGLDNREIERRLVVSPKTVRNHVTSIYGKLRVAGRAEAIVRAREAGLGVEG